MPKTTVIECPECGSTEGFTIFERDITCSECSNTWRLEGQRVVLIEVDEDEGEEQ